MEVPERAMDSGTATSKVAGNQIAGHTPNTSKERSMEYRTLGRTGIEDGDATLDDERQIGP